MNAIVSLYKNFILFLLFITLVAAMLAGLLIASSSEPLGPSEFLTIGLIGGATLLSILVVAWSAVIISIHDRHNEIAEGIHRIADALEARKLEGQPDAS